MSNDNNNYFFSNINGILSLLQKSGVSVTIDNHRLSCVDDKGRCFYLNYSEDYLRLIMKDNDVYSLYGIANILKEEVDIPTIQYSITYQDSEIFHPVLEWRFDDQDQYLTRIINHPVLDESSTCSYFKLMNGKEIADYQREKTFLKK